MHSSFSLPKSLRTSNIGVAVNSNGNRVTFRSLPDLSMNDDHLMASLDVAEPNLRDIRDSTEANISGDPFFKEFIKGRTVDRSTLFQRKFSGSKDQDDKQVMSL